MKVNVGSLDIAIQKASSVIKSKVTLPILECVLFHWDKIHLNVIATDLEVTIIKRINVEDGPDEEFKIAVQARDIKEYIALLNLDDIFLKVEQDKLIIDYGFGTSEFPYYPGDEFPGIPELADPVIINTVDTDTLREYLGNAIKYVANDELRPVMTGVYCELENGNLRLTATDAHKIYSVNRIKTGNENDKTSFVLPAKGISAILKLQKMTYCTIYVNETNTSIKTEDGMETIVVRNIDGLFPNYRAVVPTNLEEIPWIKLDRKDFIKAIKLVKSSADRVTKTIKVTYESNDVNIQSSDIDRGRKSNYELRVEESSEEDFKLDVGYNGNYFLVVLETASEPQIKIHVQQSKINVIGSLDDELIAIMPVMLNV